MGLGGHKRRPDREQKPSITPLGRPCHVGSKMGGQRFSDNFFAILTNRTDELVGADRPENEMKSGTTTPITPTMAVHTPKHGAMVNQDWGGTQYAGDQVRKRQEPLGQDDQTTPNMLIRHEQGAHSQSER